MWRLEGSLDVGVGGDGPVDGVEDKGDEEPGTEEEPPIDECGAQSSRLLAVVARGMPMRGVRA